MLANLFVQSLLCQYKYLCADIFTGRKQISITDLTKKDGTEPGFCVRSQRTLVEYKYSYITLLINLLPAPWSLLDFVLLGVSEDCSLSVIHD